MPKALQPRPGRSAGPKRVVSTLPKDVLAELRSTAKVGRADMAISRLDRAIALLERDDAAGAASEALKAKDMAPRSGAVREIAALALYRQGRFREALVEAQSYRRLTGRADQNHIIADCYRATGQPERAVPLAEEALRSQRVPLAARVEAVIVAASALADLGRFDQALGLLRRVKTREDVGGPEVLRVWYVTADILERSGRLEDAEREFRKILRHDARAYDVAERLAALGSVPARAVPREPVPREPSPRGGAPRREPERRSPEGRGGGPRRASGTGAKGGAGRSGTSRAAGGGAKRTYVREGAAGATGRTARTGRNGQSARTGGAGRAGGGASSQGRSSGGSGGGRGAKGKGTATGGRAKAGGRAVPTTRSASGKRANPRKGGAEGGRAYVPRSSSAGSRSPRRSK